jgi:hypothetical protein
MILFTGESDLKGTKWCIEDVINLQTRLTDEEFEENISEAMLDMDRLRVCARILNERKALPVRYKELVADYAGNSKADAEVKIDM